MIKISSRHYKTLIDAYTKPPKSNIEWREVESLLYALGAELEEGNGSRVRVYLNGFIAIFHRPHPRKEIDKGAIISLAKFLQNAGVTINEI